MASTIAITLSLITISLLLIILLRFKKIFSTDNIIEKTKSYMDKMLKDINGQANRDLELINESSRRLRALLSETEHKMEQFREASKLLQNAIAEAEKLNRLGGESPLYVENKNISEIKPVRKPEMQKPQQRSLFDIEEEPEESPILDDVTHVMPDGAAYKHIPLIITKVLDEEPGNVTHQEEGSSKASFEKFHAAKTNKKEFSEQVMDLFNKGLQVDQIANELSCSITEVQFVIDMGL